jgi:hypothetical protein
MSPVFSSLELQVTVLYPVSFMLTKKALCHLNHTALAILEMGF